MSHIIIVEDDIILGQSFAELYFLNDHEVEIVGDGQLAVEHVRNAMPDLLILDMHLPHVNGLEILHQLRAIPELKNLKIAVVSADAAMVNSASPLADAALLKPVTIEQLLNLIDMLS